MEAEENVSQRETTGHSGQSPDTLDDCKERPYKHVDAVARSPYLE